MKDRRRILFYVLLDFLSALLAWQIFNVFRFNMLRNETGYLCMSGFLISAKAVWLDCLVPVLWLVIYFFSGYYANPRRKTNLGDFMSTALSTLIGVLTLFFLVVINDYPDKTSLYYTIAIGLFIIHFTCTWLLRLMQTAPLLHQHTRGSNCIPILIIGTGENAKRIFREFNKNRTNFVYLLKGFVRTGTEKDTLPLDEILGNIDQIGDLIFKYQVEELVFATDSHDPDLTQQLLNEIYIYRIPVKAMASRQDILSGKVSLFSLLGIPMINLTPSLMPEWQKNIKYIFDRVMSLIVLLILQPFFLYFAIRVRLDSPGKIFYSQERVGKNGKNFRIYKFRTMYSDSEPEYPLLSSMDDPRITRYGRFMRKYRVDEIPQFWNVLKGDMSFVGPRPERQYFVNQIVLKAPHYYLTQSVLPGITSWGMVKFGYANTVDKMIERLEYDIIYLENQSILIDFIILVFTLKPLIAGKGM